MMARAGRKASAAAKRRQTTRAGQGRTDRDMGTAELRAVKRWATGRTDLAMDPLGVLFGHGKIDDDLYRAGQRLEAARRACFGADAAAERDVYGEQMALGSSNGRRAVTPSAETEDIVRREDRIAAEYERLLHALHRCGPAVTAATLGIATRPYAGAWVATALVEPGRPWTARHDTRLALIREGLAAIEKLGSRPL
ncbi:MAG TPA: hypothetical protein VH722_04995 [Alphaproteobacteria bacterium]|jgi:hypothetical protein|nr:hypothetical protein [Alphaproteobacteria bacterium]